MITNCHREVVTPEQACPECEALFLFKGGSLARSRMEVQN
jgi:hypothetical protein